MSNQGKPDPNKGSRDQYQRHVDGSIRVSGQVEVHPPPDSVKEEKTDREHQRSHRDKNYIVSISTLIAVIIYALITFWQGCMTRESIDNNTKQFQIDQRPYLWTTNTKPEMSIQKDQRMWVNIHMVDFGKSPAIKIRVLGKIFIGSNAKDDADKWFGLLEDKFFDDPNMTETVAPPGIPSIFPQPSEKEKASKIEPGKPEPWPGGFGGGGYFTVMTDNVLKQPDVDYVLNTDESAFIVMRLRYFDGFGNRYWSDICLSRFASGAVPDCPRHNEIH